MWEIILALIGVLLGIIAWLLADLRRDTALISISNIPREGLPQHIEAAWEDIGDRGRFLTDLGGMSIAMREQMLEEFCTALNKPILGTPAAGSPNDVLADLDEWLTQQKLERQRVIESD